jgi:hypothetical protein
MAIFCLTMSKSMHIVTRVEQLIFRERSTNCTVDRGAGFWRLVPGGPSGGRKFSDSIDQKIG